ncbi:MAG: acyl-CoA dehydrogenase [Alphaproteobacteria bacterium]|nr:acyl-CoA dehydrogenase [Alphaproteobacteria bacterium]
MPTAYTPPLADIRFILHRLIGWDKIAAMPAHAAVDAGTADAVLDEAGKIAAEQFAPLNDVGDKHGVKFDNGNITMPPGFRDAYRAFVEGGWNTLPVEPEYGGQGLPWLLAMPVQEMLQGANIGLALATLLNQGAIELLCAHGDDRIKKIFLPNLVSGAWAGTMNLTEPQAGSDVGAVRARAVKDGDCYSITGQKIFISYGDHDLTDNILHLVLARLPDAPEGTRGLSLFLVPKILVNEDGTLGAPNDVRAVSVEHKMGQHASPTCIMAYGDGGKGAAGYLVGQENGGIAAMFTMMNNARIGVGIQGLGLMERAYQQARDYARTRVQSRAIDAPKEPPVAIINHPDVRRMLMTMRALTEAGRALAYSCALAVDTAKYGSDGSKSQAALRVDILTPIVKGWLTDMANDVTSTGVQVFGGMGYIEETGAAQVMRDARILAIYEGTNGIQANDLVFRKIARDNGAAINSLFAEIDAFLHETSGMAALSTMRGQLASSLRDAKTATGWIAQNARTNPAAAAAVAAYFLRLCGNVLGGFYLTKSAHLAHEDLAASGGDADFLNAKIATAGFYAAHILPHSAALAAIIQTGAASVLVPPGTA